MAFKVPEQGIPPVDSMERLKHIGVPAGNCCISRTDRFKEIRYNDTLDAGHVAGRDKEQVTLSCKDPGMQSPDRADALPDIRDAPDIPQIFEAPALFRVFCHDNDLIGYVPEGVCEPLDERLSLEPEEKFLLPVGPPGFPADKDKRRSQLFSPLS
jgi:hypothetical protein